MKCRTLTLISAISLLAALALPVEVAAQHTRYKLIDIGTFGGPASLIAPSSGGPQNPARALTSRGVVVGQAETATPDPFSPNCFNPYCLASHAFRWQDGCSQTSAHFRGSIAISAAVPTGLMTGDGLPELHIQVESIR